MITQDDMKTHYPRSNKFSGPYDDPEHSKDVGCWTSHAHMQAIMKLYFETSHTSFY